MEIKVELIISHKYKFIFIKTAKTAGTSLEIALSKFCGSDDIISPLPFGEEEVRKNLGYRGPQNYFIPKSRYGIKDWRRFLTKGKKQRYRKHNSANQIRRYIGEEIWNSYFKFCVERNPWDRFISWYYYMHIKEQRPSISEFLESKLSDFLPHRGYYLYTIDDEVVVDKICSYENLAEDLEEVRIRCDLPEKIVLPKANASTRKDRRSYREILTEEQAEKIREISSKEIALLGYEF